MNNKHKFYYKWEKQSHAGCPSDMDTSLGHIEGEKDFWFTWDMVPMYIKYTQKLGNLEREYTIIQGTEMFPEDIAKYWKNFEWRRMYNFAIDDFGGMTDGCIKLLVKKDVEAGKKFVFPSRYGYPNLGGRLQIGTTPASEEKKYFLIPVQGDAIVVKTQEEFLLAHDELVERIKVGELELLEKQNAILERKKLREEEPFVKGPLQFALEKFQESTSTCL